MAALADAATTAAATPPSNDTRFFIYVLRFLEAWSKAVVGNPDLTPGPAMPADRPASRTWTARPPGYSVHLGEPRDRMIPCRREMVICRPAKSLTAPRVGARPFVAG
jgi:hypothetical protein